MKHMSEYELSTDVQGLEPDVLNHSSEFVELVYRDAPDTYRRLLASERFGTELAGSNAFNHGKLYAYAQFMVFRREFQQRFPDASAAACIEGTDDRDQLRLNSPA
jgi:hypothetical protein